MTSRIPTMDELQDKLDTMRRQEQRYACGDYTRPVRNVSNSSSSSQRSCSSTSSSRRSSLSSTGGASQQSPPSEEPQNQPQTPSSEDLLHLLLAECASLVTDPTVAAETKSLRSQRTTTRKSSRSQRLGTPERREKPKAVPKSPVGVDEPVEAEEDTLATTASTMSSSPSFSSLQHLQEQQDYYVPPDLAYWRLQMFDWACMVVDGFHMDRCAVLSTAFNLLDRYTTVQLQLFNSSQYTTTTAPEKEEPITRDGYQLYAMTALYMAVKVLEPYPRKMSLETLVVMSRNYYTRQDLLNTELQMLTALKWRTTPPTSILFCRELEPLLHYSASSKSGNKDQQQHLQPQYSQQFMADFEQVYSTICDVTVSDPYFLNHRPSVIALAALFHAARLTGCSKNMRAQMQQRGVTLLRLDAREQTSLERVYQKLESLYC